ncbi:RNA recognition motif (RRM)-containing protein [Artemisia annua]|uniref:RNA recognition motif (RRM)-containing protein n=1 Tax=Artemisia annua TaxID=35608 RepID=A0A2U1KHT8_ARTAN|nr:RNA recognition motif (RRM)-containing protein [Artemisia annua]
MDTASTITSSDSSLTEEKRYYRESLEERGLKKEEIEKKVAAHQKQLQYKYGLTDHNEDSSHKRTSSERREKRDDSRESSRKRQRSHYDSESPQRKSSSRDREKGEDELSWNS